MDRQLSHKTWFMGDEFTIADISMHGWVRNLIGFYGAGDPVGFDQYCNVSVWFERGLAQQAVRRGLNIPPAPT